jgi:hypothetical protein
MSMTWAESSVGHMKQKQIDQGQAVPFSLEEPVKNE